MYTVCVYLIRLTRFQNTLFVTNNHDKIYVIDVEMLRIFTHLKFASRVHNSVHSILFCLQEQPPSHILLTQRHLTSCVTDSGWSSERMDLNFLEASGYQPSCLGSSCSGVGMRACCKTLHCICARRM